MKKVILIGDSIRIGYQETVRSELKEEAKILWPDENGGDSRNVLKNLDAWVVSREPDVVHLNCGLHDLKAEFGSGKRQISLQDYEANVSQILKEIGYGTDARLIWATCTPVNEKWHRENKEFDRFEADVIGYNQAAVRACDPVSVVVNDLYPVVEQAGRDGLLIEDGVNFNDRGKAILGFSVARFIRPFL